MLNKLSEIHTLLERNLAETITSYRRKLAEQWVLLVAVSVSVLSCSEWKVPIQKNIKPHSIPGFINC